MGIEFRLGHCIGVVGEKGRGKTTLCFRLIQQIKAKRKWVFCCKPDEVKMWGALVGKKQVIYYKTEDQLTSQLTSLLSSPQNYHQSVVYLDDFQVHIDSKRGEYPESVKELVLTGRSLECSPLFALHYARRFPPIVRSEVDHWFIHKPSPLAMDPMEQLFTEDLMLETRKMDRHQFLYYCALDEKQVIMGPVKPLTEEERSPEQYIEPEKGEGMKSANRLTKG